MNLTSDHKKNPAIRQPAPELLRLRRRKRCSCQNKPERCRLGRRPCRRRVSVIPSGARAAACAVWRDRAFRRREANRGEEEGDEIRDEDKPSEVIGCRREDASDAGGHCGGCCLAPDRAGGLIVVQSVMPINRWRRFCRTGVLDRCHRKSPVKGPICWRSRSPPNRFPGGSSRVRRGQQLVN